MPPKLLKKPKLPERTPEAIALLKKFAKERKAARPELTPIINKRRKWLFSELRRKGTSHREMLRLKKAIYEMNSLRKRLGESTIGPEKNIEKRRLFEEWALAKVLVEALLKENGINPKFVKHI